MARASSVLPFVLIPKGVVNLAFGAGLVLAPQALLTLYGAKAAEGVALLPRLLGLALLALAAVQILGRKAEDSHLRTVLIGAFAAADLVGLALVVAAQLAGAMNPLGWSVVAIFTYAGLGFAFAFLLECGAGEAKPRG